VSFLRQSHASNGLAGPQVLMRTLPYIGHATTGKPLADRIAFYLGVAVTLGAD
jgi:hypothetical protein